MFSKTEKIFRRRIPLTILLVMGICLLFPAPAHAGYLDPGSGSSLVQGIIATIAAVKRFWRSLTGFFSGKKEE